jgi:hypothetical protein
MRYLKRNFGNLLKAYMNFQDRAKASQVNFEQCNFLRHSKSTWSVIEILYLLGVVA